MKRKEYAAISVMIGILLFPALSGALPPGVTERSDLTTLSTALIEETGVLLVDFVDDASPETIAAVEEEYGLALKPNSIFSGAEKLMRAEVARSRLPGLVERLSHDPRVEIAEPEMIYAIPRGTEIPTNEGGEEPEGFPNDPLFKYQWHMAQIKVQEAWKRSKGEDVIVAVIDTGVAYENRGKFHRVEDLEKTAFVPGYDFVHDTEHANDDNCHGTHVAGTIAQSTHNGKGVAGVAFKAKIMPIKVLTAQGFGTTADIAEGIRYAADHGAKVINMSLGGPYPSKIMADACKYAYQKGVTIVCAAGNSGSRKVGYPAAYPECIAVSAVRYDETLTFYSSWGKEIDIAAPGGDLNVDQNGDGYKDGVLQNTIEPQNPQKEDYLLFQGTSMAAPHVAGAAALIVARGVTNPKKVKEILQKTARPKDDPEKYGAGILDAGAAVRKADASLTFGRGFFALLLTFGMFRLTRRSGASIRTGHLPFVGGLLLGMGGLSILPDLGISLGPLTPYLCAPFADWHVSGFGHSPDQNPLFYSALFPLLFTLFFLHRRNLGRLAAGFAIGTAALLAYHTFVTTADVRWIPGILADKAWLSLNAVISFTLGYLALKQER